MLKLTLAIANIDVFVAINHIVSLETIADGTFVSTAKGGWTVREHADHIYEWINEAKGLSA